MASSNYKITLFALPFAGGSKYSYNSLKNVLPDSVVFCPIDLPGRGMRMRDSLLNNIHDLIEDIYNQIKNNLHQPYALYGHSMGSTLVYLLARKIISESKPAPLHLIVSGRGAPACKNEKIRYLMAKDEFKDELIALGGIPSDLMEDEGIMDFMEPILRADFQAIETYQHISEQPLHIPITVLIGKDDTPTMKDVMEWQTETAIPIKIHQYPGGHFFLYNHLQQISDVIVDTLFVR
jgi:surfactin synthase thioesterase subunit